MALFFTPLAAQTPVPLPFDHVSSVIYDNDDCRDVYSDEYFIASHTWDRSGCRASSPRMLPMSASTSCLAQGGRRLWQRRGQAASPLTRPEYIMAVKRWRVEGIDDNGDLILTEDTQGPVYEAPDAEQSTPTAEFWRVMEAAAQTLR